MQFFGQIPHCDLDQSFGVEKVFREGRTSLLLGSALSLKILILFLKISYIQRRFSAGAMPKFKKIYKCTMLLISRCIFVSQTSLKSKEYKIISLFIQNYRTDTT